jgi:hypothetical protein
MEEPIMANQPNPDDPRRSNLADDPYRSNLADQPYRTNRDAARLDNELQADPELAEGPASGGKIAMFAVAVAVVFGAVFYGLNNSSINQPGTASTAQNTTQSSPPAAPAGMRDVTPRGNTDQGMTTGAAPAQPAPAPSGAMPGAAGNPASK